MLKSNLKRISILLVMTLVIGSVAGCDKKAPEEITEPESLLYTEILDTLSGNPEDKYDLAEVRSGDYEHKIFAIGQVEYRDLYYQTLDIEEARVVEWNVSEGDEVKKGDVILTYTAVFDEVTYAQKVADVTRQEKDYTAGYDMRRAEIIMAEHSLKEITDKNEKEIKKLEIKKLKLALNAYMKQKSGITELKNEIAQYKNGINTTEVIANHDGFVMECGDFKADDIIRKGNIVATISPMKDYIIRIDDLTEGNLRFNDDVKVRFESDKGNTELDGKVIMSSNILSYGNAQNYAYVKLVDVPSDFVPKGTIKIFFSSKALKNVLLVDAEAVNFETMGEGTTVEEVPYVYIFENGNAYKRYIEVFGNNREEYLVLQGLTAGQKVVKQIKTTDKNGKVAQ